MGIFLIGISFLLGYLPANKIYINSKQIYLNPIKKYFNYSESILFMKTEVVLILILLQIFKSLIIVFLVKYFNAQGVVIWFVWSLFILGNFLSSDFLKFRGTFFTLIYLSFLKEPYAGTLFSLYVLGLVFFRSQKKASIMTITIFFLLGIYFYNFFEVIFLIMPATALILKTYYPQKFTLPSITFFKYTNKMY